MISNPCLTHVHMNNKMETTEEGRIEGSAFLESRKGRRDESENEEQTVCKKPRVTTSDDQTDNADDGQDGTAKETQMPCDDKTEGLMDNVLQKQDETQNVDEVKPDNTEKNQNAGEKDTDNEKKRQMGQNEEDDAEGKREKASSVQTGVEEVNERRKRVENETSNGRTSNDINMSTGINCAAPDEEEESRRDEEARGDKYKNKDNTQFNITPENTTKFEELKDADVGDAAVNSGDKPKDSSEQPLDEETEDQKQKLNERNMFPVGTGGDKMKQKRDVSRKNSDAKEKTQEGHSEEDDRQKETDLSSNFSASLPTEGKIVKNATSNGQTSPFEGTTTGCHDRDTSTDESCATLSGRKSSEKGNKKRKKSKNEDKRLLGITQTNEEEKDMKWKIQPVSQSQKRHRGHYGHHGHYGHRGHYGLYNQGATCYLNSLLQVLFMTSEIHDRLDPNSELDRELINIFKHLKKTTSETINITKVLGIEDVFTQHDAPECLKLILQKMSPGTSEIFQGELAHTTKCSEGHSINEEVNPFWTLPLSLEDTDDTCSLERSFVSFFQKKVFTGDNQVYCNECNIKTDATSKCEMVESPQILTLILKRFDFNLNTMSYVKSHCCVEVPCELKTKDTKYKLYGMVNHIGGLYGGHYTATVLSNDDQTWYECSDSHVYKVQEQPFAKTGTYRSDTVYLLMYRATECQRPSETNQNGDELVTIPQEPPGTRPGLKALNAEYYLVFCVLLWLVVIILVIASFLLS